MTQTLNGMAASPGVAIGPVWVYRPVEITIDSHTITDTEGEWKRFEAAIAQSAKDLLALQQRALQMAGQEEAAIFEAHSMFLSDPELLNSIRTMVFDQKMNVEKAVSDSCDNFASVMAAMENEYFKARATDIIDVGNRIVRCLLGIADDVVMPEYPVIVLAEDLTPSDTVQFEKDLLLGICTLRGGPTSHTAILSRSIGIPAVVKAPLELDKIPNDTMLMINGDNGNVVVNPDEQQVKDGRAQQDYDKTVWEEQLKHAHEPAITLDGVTVEIVSNIGSAEDARKAVEFGAEGVGLLRTEFLYLDRNSLPDENEQIKVYKEIFDIMGKRPVVVRTLDIGGDKEVSYLGTQHEPNPFLGWRAIRMINERPEILFSQFSALLQAGVDADLRIMLPMVSNLDEILMALEIMEEVKKKLTDDKKVFNANYQFGIMVEVPSAALMAYELADYVDFFSIGTNDLTQYTLAVDRTNERVAPIASPFHPAVIRLISQTIDAAHQKGKWVGLCGEMAGDALATRLLLGLGLDEFSMSATSVPKIKTLMRTCRVDSSRENAQKVLKMKNTQEVTEYLSGLGG